MTDEPKRLFETYIKQNYAKELENPLFSAEKLWNDSAAVANGDAAAGPNSRLLDDGQLTNLRILTGLGRHVMPSCPNLRMRQLGRDHDKQIGEGESMLAEERRWRARDSPSRTAVLNSRKV